MKIKQIMTTRVVIDTNVLVASLSGKSKYHWIIELLLQGKLIAFVTDEIMHEYEEILQRKYSVTVANHFIKALRELPNVIFTHIYFQWNLLEDADDNKFVDCYIASNAEYLVTNDRGYGILKKIGFPKIMTLTIEQFEEMLPL